jgi:hypothetical protein
MIRCSIKAGKPLPLLASNQVIQLNKVHSCKIFGGKSMLKDLRPVLKMARELLEELRVSL